MQWTLLQAGSAVDGTVLLTNATGVVLMNGRLTGTLASTMLTYTIDVPVGGVPVVPACTGRFTGSATAAFVTPATLTGSYALASSSCAAPLPDGIFVLTKT